MKYRVVIIGGGPSGISCAVSLQKKGVPNCVIDKASFPRKKLCGGLVTEKTYNVIKGVLDDDKALGSLFSDCKITDTCSLYDGKRLLSEVRIAKPFRIISRLDFDSRMAEYCKSIGGTVYEGESVRSIDFDGRKIILSSGKEIEYEILIAADGANSTVRHLAGKKLDTVAFCLEGEFPVKAENEGIRLYFNVIGKGYGWDFPTSGGRRIGFGNTFRRGYEYKKQFDSFLSDTAAAGCESKVSGAYLPYGGYLKKPYFGDSVLFTGDAAGFADPISGEGIYYAFLSGRLAAEAVISADGGSVTESYLRLTKPIRRRISQGLTVNRIFFTSFFQRLFAANVPKHPRFIAFYLDNFVSAGMYTYTELPRLVRDYKKLGKD